MPKFLSYLLVFIFLITAPFIALSQQELKLKKLDKSLQKILDDWKAPGMAVAIVKNDSIIFSKGYGVRDVTKGDKVDENTIFAIASNSKSFTSAAVATLVDENKLSWDDPVTKYLPYFKLYDPYVTKEITVRDLLCHRAGYKTFSGDLLWYCTNYSRKEILERYRYLKPAFGFRTQWGYSNICFLAAGEVVAAITGKSWEEYIKEKFIVPLGMTRTTTTIRDLKNFDNVAQPHTFFEGKEITIPYENWDNIAPAGAINSCVKDMAQWLLLQLNKGTYKGTKYFSETVCREMWSSQIPMSVSKGSEKFFPTIHFKSYGLGWSLFDYYGRKIISHSGGYDGMLSYTCVIPEDKTGFVILTNTNTPIYNTALWTVLDALLSNSSENKDWNKFFLDKYVEYKKTEAIAKTEKSINGNSKPTLETTAYCGIYKSELYGNAEVKIVNGKMEVQLIPAPLFLGKLTHQENDVYKIVFENFPSLPSGTVSFILKDKSKVEEMKIDVPNPDFDFTELKFLKQ